MAIEKSEATLGIYSSGGSKPVAGAASTFDEKTVTELMRLPPSPEHPLHMTRFPVSMEEYYRLKKDARKPGPVIKATLDVKNVGMDIKTEAAASEPEALVIITSFEGIPQTAKPPDCTIAVGPNDVLVAVNTDLAVYTKAGDLRSRFPNMTFPFGSILPSGAFIFDPQVAYDHYAQRWIVVVGAKRNSPHGAWLMIGVSQGTDPTGAYWVWALDAALNGDTPTDNFAENPRLGFDTQAIYISSHMGGFNGSEFGSKLRILNKKELYAGGNGENHHITWYDFWDLKNPDNSLAGFVQPAIHFRDTVDNPPAYLINAIWPNGSSLTLWKLDNPIGSWTGGSPSLSRMAVNCMSYEMPPDAIQLGTDNRILINGSQIQSAVYQDRDGVQRLWTCHTTKVTWAGETEARSAVQWYEIDVPSKTVVQQSRQGAPGKYYFYPAIQTDINSNAYLVFGRSGSDEYAQVRQTGRAAIDPFGLRVSTLVKSGESSYLACEKVDGKSYLVCRWGDYFGICLDGGDSSIVWMYGQYAGPGNIWKTRVCAAKFKIGPL